MTNYIEKNNQKQIVAILKHILGDTFTLYFKTHTYHWNVEGPQFHGLHNMFEEQYTDMWGALDEIAERIRMLGAYAPVSVTELANAGDLSDADNIPNGMDMVKDLAKDHATLSAHIATAIEKCSDMGDEGTVDLLVGRQAFHDKAAWMLNATAK